MATYTLKYKLDEANQTYSVTGAEENVDIKADEILEIPALYNGLPVVGIEQGAFYNQILIRGKIQISDTVKTIGNTAFFSCANVKEIEFGKGLKEIGNNAFEYCGSNGMTSITLPNSIEKIGSNAFYNIYALNEIIYKGTEQEWQLVSKGENWVKPRLQTPIFQPEDSIVKNYQIVDTTWLEGNLTNIAEAIREKTGKSALIAFEDMATAIGALNVPIFNIKPVDVSQSYAIGNTWRRSKEERSQS